jgi:hypothetical protein
LALELFGHDKRCGRTKSQERDMSRHERNIEPAHHRRIAWGFVVRTPASRTVDPLKIIDGIPKKQTARLQSERTPSIVPRNDPDGLPGHGRYGSMY